MACATKNVYLVIRPVQTLIIPSSYVSGVMCCKDVIDRVNYALHCKLSIDFKSLGFTSTNGREIKPCYARGDLWDETKPNATIILDIMTQLELKPCS